MLGAAVWLDDDTKRNARDKLTKMNLKVGYPDYILNDAALDYEYQDVYMAQSNRLFRCLG